VAIIIDPPTDEEVNAAITGNMGHLVTVVGARNPYDIQEALP
jgi:[calcium/calmodulin-dependent protein kinase] kinase